MTFIKQIIFSFAIIILGYAACAQEIVNIVYVGDKGITEDLIEAHSFIAIKQYPDGVFERLDYKMGAPLVLLRTYNDSNLTNLNGKYLKYDGSGALQISGQYNNNQKVNDWFYYNDTGKIIKTETYNADVLIQTVNSDTVKNNSIKYPDERDAEFARGNSAWTKYLQNALMEMPSELYTFKGNVYVMFMISSEGKTTDIYLKKSALFVLDEEALKIIRLSPLWKPAFQNGRTVNANRLQPFTFAGEVQ